MRIDNRSVTPSFAETVQTLIDANLINMNICLPAEIVEYDPKTQKASVQPQLMRKYENGTIVQLPVIPNVPVIQPRSGAAYLHFPLAKGDNVTLIFSQRSLDNWKSEGGMVDPADRRKFNISDAFAIPGGYDFSHAFTPADTEALELSIVQGTLNHIAQKINLGSKSPTKSVAVAESVVARLQAIENELSSLISQVNTFITTYNVHTHLSTAPGSPTSPPAAPGVPASPFTPDTSVVASAKVKVDP